MTENSADSEKTRLAHDAEVNDFGEVPDIVGNGSNGPKGAPEGIVEFGVGVRSDGKVVVNFGVAVENLLLTVKDAKRFKTYLGEAISEARARGKR